MTASHERPNSPGSRPPLPVMAHNSRPVGRFETSTERKNAQDTDLIKTPTSDYTRNLYVQLGEDMSDTSSIYSNHEAENKERSLSVTSSASSRSMQQDLDLALPYLEIVAQLRQSIYPSWPKEGLCKSDATPAESPTSESMSSSPQSEDAQLFEWARSGSTSKESYSSRSTTEENPSRPVLYTEPQLESNGRLKAVQFQNAAKNLAAPLPDRSRAGVPWPLWIEGGPTMPGSGLRKSRSLLSLRRHGRSQLDIAPDDKKAKDVLDSKDEPPVFHPLTNVPIRKGWVKKVVRTITERGQQSNL
ncbi:hypothetical protein OPT61_g6544 [Boeremia exigua]|uniref:Uncharacterized protein n=1 Tax=Boeremia exigua TaxID=749465 RepID=A0ACC2I6A6_9PLEO|nr:hypothetical protein OPT61_g6544 [Boeremia exigua]